MEIEKDKTIEIAHLTNCFILKHNWWDDTSEEGDKIIKSDIEAFEIDDSMLGDEKAFIKLVKRLAEIVGLEDDKYGEHNLEINFDKKGTDWEEEG